MTSPSVTLTPFSNWPTATTSAVCGFSLAVSGSTIPEAVVSSRSTIWTSARSPNGLNFIRLTSLCLRTLVRRPARRPGSYPTRRSLCARDCNRECCYSQLQAELRRELVPRQGSYGLLGDLPLLEAGDGRDAGDAVVHGRRGVVVHVDLDKRHVVARLGHLFQDRGDAPARHAPGRPEIYYYRPLRAQNVALKSRIRYFGYRHSLEPPLVSRERFSRNILARVMRHQATGFRLQENVKSWSGGEAGCLRRTGHRHRLRNLCKRRDS